MTFVQTRAFVLFVLRCDPTRDYRWRYIMASAETRQSSEGYDPVWLWITDPQNYFPEDVSFG